MINGLKQKMPQPQEKNINIVPLFQRMRERGRPAGMHIANFIVFEG